MCSLFDRIFSSVLPWIETVTPGYYQSMETEVLFQIEFSLAIMFELIISSSCFFARKTFYFTGLRALCEGLFFSCLGTDFLLLEFGKKTVPKISLSLPSYLYYTAASGVVWLLLEHH